MANQFPKPGEVFEGTYNIQSILGSGGFARVYKAKETGLGREVALKILRPPVNPDQTDDERDRYLKTLMERFQREALLLSRLRSPNTITMYKYGQTPNGLLYMALEYIDGMNLNEVMRSVGHPLSPERAVTILRQVLTSLREAHAMEILHRDLKPGNIMVFDHMGETDQVKLLDFGIAKLVDDASSNSTREDLTSDGTLIGTPRYMAPEQIRGDSVGPASDLYALGLVGFELVTGHRAIQGDSSIQIIGKQLAPESFRITDDFPCPPRLRLVINKMIQKDLRFRFTSADDILEALADPELLGTQLGSQEILDFDLPEIQDVEVLDDDSFIVTPPAAQKSKLPLVLLLGALGVFMVFGAVYASGSDPEPVEAAVIVTPDEPTVTVSAELNGLELAGAQVLINEVEMGVTPFKATHDEIRDSTVVVLYTHPNTKEALRSEQDVTHPREVRLVFSPKVSVKDAVLENPPAIRPIESKPVEEKTKRSKKVKRDKPKVKTAPKTKPKVDEPKKTVEPKVRRVVGSDPAPKKEKGKRKRRIIGQ